MSTCELKGSELVNERRGSEAVNESQELLPHSGSFNPVSVREENTLDPVKGGEEEIRLQ